MCWSNILILIRCFHFLLCSQLTGQEPDLGISTGSALYITHSIPLWLYSSYSMWFRWPKINFGNKYKFLIHRVEFFKKRKLFFFLPPVSVVVSFLGLSYCQLLHHQKRQTALWEQKQKALPSRNPTRIMKVTSGHVLLIPSEEHFPFWATSNVHVYRERIWLISLNKQGLSMVFDSFHTFLYYLALIDSRKSLQSTWKIFGLKLSRVFLL